MNYYDYHSAPWFNSTVQINTVVISEGIQSIGENAFSGCSSHISVTIPGIVENIGNNAFAECSNAMTISGYGGTCAETCANANGYKCTFNGYIGNCGDNASWVLDNKGVLKIFGSGDMYNLNNGEMWSEYNNDINTVIIGNEITCIGENAFNGCTSLESIVLPERLSEIRENAFIDCAKIVEITIPGIVSKINSFAFSGCNNLVLYILRAMRLCAAKVFLMLRMK